MKKQLLTLVLLCSTFAGHSAGGAGEVVKYAGAPIVGLVGMGVIERYINKKTTEGVLIGAIKGGIAGAAAVALERVTGDFKLLPNELRVPFCYLGGGALILGLLNNPNSVDDPKKTR